MGDMAEAPRGAWTDARRAAYEAHLTSGAGHGQPEHWARIVDAVLASVKNDRAEIAQKWGALDYDSRCTVYGTNPELVEIMDKVSGLSGGDSDG